LKGWDLPLLLTLTSQDAEGDRDLARLVESMWADGDGGDDEL
jgi:hypothetical protein